MAGRGPEGRRDYDKPIVWETKKCWKCSRREKLSGAPESLVFVDRVEDAMLSKVVAVPLGAMCCTDCRQEAVDSLPEEGVELTLEERWKMETFAMESLKDERESAKEIAREIDKEANVMGW